MKDGLHNLQTYFTTILAPRVPQDGRGYDAQQREYVMETRACVPVPRQSQTLNRNPTPMYTSTNPILAPTSTDGASHVPSSANAETSANATSAPPHRYPHQPTLRGSASATGATDSALYKGVAPAVLVQAVRRMLVHIIYLPPLSADEETEARLAEQSSPSQHTPRQDRRAAGGQHGPLDTVCRALCEQSALTAGCRVPVGSISADTPLAARYFMYEENEEGNLTDVQIANFRGCSVCLKSANTERRSVSSPVSIPATSLVFAAGST